MSYKDTSRHTLSQQQIEDTEKKIIKEESFLVKYFFAGIYTMHSCGVCAFDKNG